MAITAGVLRHERVLPRTGVYFWMAVAMAATGFLGFAPTFWIPLAHGAYASPVLSIHGGLFSLWLVFLVLQTRLVASGHVARHRALGLFGISLASVMVVFGFLAAIHQTHRADLAGSPERGLAFMIVPVWHILAFAGLTAAAIMNIRRPDWHKRLMLGGTAMLMDAPIARPLLLLKFNGHIPVPTGLPAPPPHVLGPLTLETFLALPFFLVPMLYDWRTRGRPHPAYWCAFAIFVFFETVKGQVSVTPEWLAVARFLYSLAG